MPLFVQIQRRRTINVTHVVIESTKPFGNVRAFLEAVMPPIGSQRSEAWPGLVIVLKRDHGAAVQYEIGHVLTEFPMGGYNVAAALYAPLRVVLYEDEAGGSRFEYDLPSSLLEQFGDDRSTEVGRALDEALVRELTDAAG